MHEKDTDQPSLTCQLFYVTHQRILSRIEEEIQAAGGVTGGGGLPHHHDRFYPSLHDKERKYKSERNMYLAGFALTLLFVIGRITTLLAESVELHEETERVEKQLKKEEGKNTDTTTTAPKDEEAKKAD